MKLTTNTREGDATILGIWNLQRNHFRYLESAARLSGNTRKKEKGKKARISKKKKDNLRYMTYWKIFVSFHESLPFSSISSADTISAFSIPFIHSKQQRLGLPASAVGVFSTRAIRRNKQIPSSGAMGNTNHLFSLPLLLLPLLAPSVAAKPDKLETRAGLFKGEPVPEVNWMSSDIVNFTWGLTGVDNFENLMFS